MKARARGHVIQDQGTVRGLDDRAEVQKQTAIRGLVVVGRDRQKRICPGARGVLGQTAGVRRGIGSAARDQRNATRDVRLGKGHQSLMLLLGQRGTLPRCSRHQKGVHPRRDLALDDPLQRRVVDLALPKGGDQRGGHSPKYARLVQAHASTLLSSPHAQRLFGEKATPSAKNACISRRVAV